MDRVRALRPIPWLTATIIAIGPLFLGCGGTKDGEVVIPKVSPAEESKDSMNYYHDVVAKKAKSKKK